MTCVPSRPRLAAVAAGTALLALAACTTTGTGQGDLQRRGRADAPVPFSWASDDGGISGTMTAVLPDATYTGTFFQITEQTESQDVAPLWDGWDSGWLDWPDAGWELDSPYAWSTFTTHYTGRVLANLSSAHGGRMRCRLRLAKPADGMSGGGAGTCQLGDKSVIQAQFARESGL